MDAKEFTVHDRLGPLILTGKLLADGRFGAGPRKLRWTDMALYQVVETPEDQRITVSCEGCLPARSLLVAIDTLAEAPIVCGQCQKPFAPDRVRKDRPFRYAIEIIARSLVYHRMGSACVSERHMITTVGEVKKSPERWENLEPCNKCRALDLEDMADSDKIAEERSDTHVHLCTNAAAVLRRLYHHSGQISQLAATVLEEAARKDRDIAAALSSRRRI